MSFQVLDMGQSLLGNVFRVLVTHPSARMTSTMSHSWLSLPFFILLCRDKMCEVFERAKRENWTDQQPQQSPRQLFLHLQSFSFFPYPFSSFFNTISQLWLLRMIYSLVVPIRLLLYQRRLPDNDKVLRNSFWLRPRTRFFLNFLSAAMLQGQGIIVTVGMPEEFQYQCLLALFLLLLLPLS